MSDPVFWPFDGRKALYHVAYWKQMLKGSIPPPVLVTLDPINRCNLNCDWCNSSATIEKRGAMYSDETIEQLPRVLYEWGVKAVCIAGGGEPLMHPKLGVLISGLTREGIGVGVVTNGTLLDRHLDVLGLCKWVGVSVDAGDAETYLKLKSLGMFPAVIQNMQELRQRHPDLEITYKVLLHPDNMHSMSKAAEVADKIGCTFFHARPAGLAWDRLDAHKLFSRDQVRLAVGILNSLSTHEWPNGLKVINTPQKFTSDTWAIHHPFEQCAAVGMSCGIQANGTVTLCCDRRGDERVQLCTWEKPEDIPKQWGTPEHWRIMSGINLSECPRCTYTPHNKLYEEFVLSLKDQSSKDFI